MFLPLRDSIEFTAEAARVCKTVLPSGVRILTEEMLGAPSVAVAASVAVGSRDETGGHFGSTHFLEHLLFKGTERRSARDISIAFDSVGGSSNAATAKEYTSYYARVENAALPLALDLILDMFSSAKIDRHDFDVERTVILEELAMNEDDPEDVAHENLSEALLPGLDLGRPIGGTVETINAVDRESVFAYYKKHYAPQNLVITVAGGVSHERVVELVEAELNRIGWTGSAEPEQRRSQQAMQLPKPEAMRIIKKDVAQANVLLGYQSLHASDPDRFALGILSTVLGGGMSSRLYQEIREERGLAYSTYCYQQGYSDAGYFGVYAGTSEENAKLVTELMRSEVQKVVSGGITAAELELALGNISGGLALRFESPLARMNRLLAAEIGTGEYLSITEVMDRFRSVTRDQIVAVANRVFSVEPTLVAVGKSLKGLR
ncbi:pitrilysin family protein [Aquiluna sp. KACHI24]|uniref:M16 family metallopeptidase n=1 Tax=Aquiluna sp. KACHI24 TaxID=2968831 RepID=UPI00220B25C1|nr:pitrilysin family protein [Aquiluna sp. KACHI24]BDQ00098.1 putative zinc protease [Aquiluna sp. KACHI24]